MNTDKLIKHFVESAIEACKKYNATRTIMDIYGMVRDAIYDHCGFVEEWTVYPIDDRTDMYWRYDGLSVRYAKSPDIDNDTMESYEDDIYAQRFYKKWVWRGKDLTLIIVDTHCDGNKFFAIYDNAKEIKT